MLIHLQVISLSSSFDQNQGLMKSHTHLTDTEVLGCEAMVFPPATITSFHRISLSLVRVAVLFLIPLPSATAQGVCDRTPQVRDRLVNATGVLSRAEVTTKHLADVTALSLWASGTTMLQGGTVTGDPPSPDCENANDCPREEDEEAIRGIDEAGRGSGLRLG